MSVESPALPFDKDKVMDSCFNEEFFCNIVNGNRVRSGICACAHLHRSMLAHVIICFVGSALLPCYLDLQKVSTQYSMIHGRSTQ